MTTFSLPAHGRPVSATEVCDAELSGFWVIDIRDRRRFADGHVPGSVGLEYGARFADHVGWLVPWGDDIVLLTDDPGHLDDALEDLAALGLDVAERVGVDLVDEHTPLTAGFRRATWSDFRTARGSRPVLVDVRDLEEWRAGHVPGAIHVPLREIEKDGRKLPFGELWIYCATGRRAGIAASLLQRQGRRVVHLDDSWEHARSLRLDVLAASA